jgi:hypothetical protein
MDLRTIRKALIDAISVVPGLNAESLRDNPIVPCAIVVPETPFDLQITFDGNESPYFIVLLLVPYNDTDGAQEQLDAYLSGGTDQSVVDAIEVDDTLGGVVGGLDVGELKSYGVMQLHDGGTRYLSAELLVRVWV